MSHKGNDIWNEHQKEIRPPMYQHFYYKGEPILDIEAFCKEHNTKMVGFKRKRREVPLMGGASYWVEENGTMPEMFFDNMRMTDGWIYEKT